MFKAWWEIEVAKINWALHYWYVPVTVLVVLGIGYWFLSKK